MCSSWLPSASRSPDSPFEIPSLLHSFTQNRRRLPGPPKFRDDIGPGRSLSSIVSHLSTSTSADRDVTSPASKHSLVNPKIAETLSETSKTESAIASASLGRRQRVDLLISQALWHSVSCAPQDSHSNRSTIYTKNLLPTSGRVQERSANQIPSAQARSNWESPASVPATENPLPQSVPQLNLTPVITSQTSDSQLRQEDSTIFNRRNFFLQNDHFQNSSECRGLEEIPGLLNKSTEEVKNFIEKSDVIEYFNEKSSSGKTESPIIATNNNSSNVVHNGVRLERKNRLGQKRVRSAQTLRNRKIKRISSSNLLNSDDNKANVEVSSSDTEIIIKESPRESREAEIHTSNPYPQAMKEQRPIAEEKIVDTREATPRNSTEIFPLKSQEQISDLQRSRLECIKRRFTFGLQRQATAKPSRTAIPSTARSRALFQPLAGIQEPEDMKKRTRKGMDRSRALVDTSRRKLELEKKLSGSENSDKSPTESQVPQKNCQFTKLEEEKPRKSFLRSKTFISTHEATKSENKFPRLKKNSEVSINERKIVSENQEKSRKHLQSMRMLKKILALDDTSKKKGSKIPTITSSKNTLKSSKTLMEKLANISDSSLASTVSSKPSKISQIPTKMSKNLQQLVAASAKLPGSSKSLQTVGEVREKSTTSTETEFINFSVDAGVSCNDLNTKVGGSDTVDTESIAMETCGSDLTSGPPAEPSCGEFVRNDEVKIVETQTCGLLGSREEKRDCSVEPRWPYKEINTERRDMIDFSTGKDQLEMQNFCCNAQLTNTEVFLLTPINYVMKKDATNQVDAVTTLIIDGSPRENVNSISGDVMTSKQCLIESVEWLPDELTRNEEEAERMPGGVVRAFEIAEERARDVFRAVEIYHETLRQNRAFCGRRENIETNPISLGVENEEKTVDPGRNLHDADTRIELLVDVRLVLEGILKTVERRVTRKKMKRQENNFGVLSLELLMHRGNILPIVYGALCSLVFWSLQFSMSCDLL